ncbi:MAG: histidine kinase [Lachnospiraceae bacterium]|nr:histidine kinase [Lachnospiraceae bacterium]
MPKNRKKNRKKRFFISIQTKLLFVFLVATFIIFGVNIYIYFNINKMIINIDKVYESNAMLNELQNGLTLIHRNLESYLDTKDTEAMEGYFRNEQEYRKQMENLNVDILNDSVMIAEKNIYNMSQYYLSITESAIEAKRGRNVAKYKEYYDDANELYGYINSYIYNLNNKRFRNNSNNYETLFSSLKYSETSNLLILFIVSVLNGTLIIFLTRGITNPLKDLAKAAGEVAKGTLDIELVESVPHDEVGIVTSAFGQMVKSLKDYIEQIKKSIELESAMKERQLMMETHLRDAQLKYLQAQINPHFMFNTLNAGAQLAMMEGADKTYRYVQNVADFFRYNVKKNNDVVTLEEEIELVDNYIYIINVRFSGDINFKKKIDRDLVNVQMPSMILQPIVENCINHGVRDIKWENLIELSVYEESGSICVSIRDNGVGMSADKIKRIMHSKLGEADLKDTVNGVGLDNVIGRLRLFYEREDVIEITSAGEDMGTEVAIYIPLEV